MNLPPFEDEFFDLLKELENETNGHNNVITKRMRVFHDYENVRFSLDTITQDFKSLKNELKAFGNLTEYSIYTDAEKEVQRKHLHDFGKVVDVDCGPKNRIDFRISIDVTKYLVRQIELHGVDPDHLVIVLICNDQDFIEISKEINDYNVELIHVRKANQPELPELSRFADQVVALGDVPVAQYIHNMRRKLKEPSLGEQVALKTLEILSDQKDPIFISKLGNYLIQGIETYQGKSDLVNSNGSKFNTLTKFLQQHPITRDWIEIDDNSRICLHESLGKKISNK